MGRAWSSGFALQMTHAISPSMPRAVPARQKNKSWPRAFSTTRLFALSSARTRGQGRRMLKGAIVGFGFISAQGHHPAYLEPEDVDIIAVADLCPARLEAA